EGFWTRRFSRDPNIVGKVVSLDDIPRTIVGVSADDPILLEFGAHTDVTLPYQLDPNATEQGQSFLVAAHLKPGVTLAQARERMKAASDVFRAKFPDAFAANSRFTVIKMQDLFIGDMRTLLLVL